MYDGLTKESSQYTDETEKGDPFPNKGRDSVLAMAHKKKGPTIPLEKRLLTSLKKSVMNVMLSKHQTCRILNSICNDQYNSQILPETLGPSCENEFLVTEIPEEGKTVYFLKCLINKGYLNIVAFFDPSGDPPNYLPRTLNESIKLGQYLIELVSVEDKGICIHSALKVRFHNKKMSRIEEYEISHFLVTIWVDENYPSCADVLKLSNMLRTHQNEQFNKKFAIHSREIAIPTSQR
ncbi:receptor-type tyrosine-protein phosphatase mu-like [Octopus vulgaris]|uniref:Receptor-type tyrosine-protein phosphatase mu-like n=1 Tax=Octopus vulgaris TaxID=6645 RepID=A0AA36FD82_OCTVU|nr:receptor-type tyrosine-protein phosphatase mu-like [Octopus vulgaris]